MTIIDLFAGIGGCSLAFDNVFHEQKNTHIFVEIDPFCQAVLRKHWPDSEIYGDIRSFASDAIDKRELQSEGSKQKKRQRPSDGPFLLTGGFPCQPFSQAGRRKGTSDDRHFWPEMLRVIRATKPQWVIAENVRGILTIGGGLVFEQVCTDLESAGYEVQPIIIPAVAVNAPHRRDRIWFVAQNTEYKSKRDSEQNGINERPPTGVARSDSDDTDSCQPRLERRRKAGTRHSRQSRRTRCDQRTDWKENWFEAAARLCRMDDGLPRRMDRNPRLKALGNAIVPQIAEEIMKTIKHDYQL